MGSAKRTKLVIEGIALAAFLVALFVVAIKLNPSVGGSFSDPASPRPAAQEEWDEIYGVGVATATSWSPDRGLWKRAIKSIDNGRITYTYSNAKGLDEGQYGYVPHHLAPGERLEIDGGFIDIPALVTGLTTAETGDSIPVSMRYFAGDLSTTDSSILEKLLGHSSLVHYHSQSGSADIGVVFRHDGLDNLRVTSQRIFDTRTRRVVSGSWGRGSRDDRLIAYGGNIEMWHNGPVDIVLDVAYGPCEVQEFAPIKGEGYSAPDADIRFIDVIPDNGFSFSGGLHGTSSQIRFGLVEESNRKGMSYLFACQPGLRSGPISVELLSADGSVISSANMNSGIHACARIRTTEKREVDRIRVTKRKTLRRVFFHLPYWPGLPAANENVEDLFDVQIPYVKIERDEQYEFLFRSALQCSRFRRKSLGSLPAGFLPREYTDTSVHDILQEYVDALDAAFTLSSDSDTLEVYPSGFGYAFERMWNSIF